MTPYGLVADVHLHRWSKFSDHTPEGLNTRLVGLLSEIERCAAETKLAGGDTVVIAGDLFHVRGSVAPSVLNPTIATLQGIHENYGTKFLILAGNHDLEGKHSDRLSSAVTALERGYIVRTVDKPTEVPGIYMVPWFENLDALSEAIESFDKGYRHDIDLIIHAPIDGVLPHLSGGLDPAWLASLGFKRVFAGHYHNHKTFAGGIHSIGALAHHTWSDVGSLAGFLIVSDTEVKRFASHLPNFVDITEGMDEDEVALRADGNFVRAKVTTSKMAEVEALRELLVSYGAKGVEIINVKTPTTERSGAIAASAASGSSIEKSIADFIKEQAGFAHKELVEMEALKVFAEAAV